MDITGKFTYSRLLKFTIPTIFMLVFISLYNIVDGFFVSNYAGKTALASLNLVFPILMILGAFGLMFGTGGSAVVAKTLGEQKPDKANKYFSMIVFSAFALGILSAIGGWIFIEPVVKLFGADGELLANSVLYSRIIILAIPAFILQNMFQILFITAGKPNLGLFVTIFAGCTNMLLDYIFIAHLNLGIKGAAVATAISQTLGGVIPLIYFAGKNSSSLRLKLTFIDIKIIFKACINGISEMLSCISTSLISMLYMWQLMRFAGENGVAAYGVIMYIQFIFTGMLMGYATGIAPVVSYNFGAKNTDELKNLFKKSLTLITLAGILLTAFAEIFACPLSNIFVSYDKLLRDLTVNGFTIFSLSFLITGFNLFASAFYTALNNGIISGIISFSRTFIFQIVSVLILPIFFGINGIWWAVVAAEVFALILSSAFLLGTRKKYGYI